MSSQVLKCASPSRPAGQQRKNYHDVLAKGLWSAHHEGDRGPAAAAGTAVLHAEHMKMALTKLVFTFPNSKAGAAVRRLAFSRGLHRPRGGAEHSHGRGRRRQADRHHQGGRRPRRPPHVARARLKTAAAASLARRGGELGPGLALFVSAPFFASRSMINMALSGVPTLR
jgi:hypothetical protein